MRSPALGSDIDDRCVGPKSYFPVSPTARLMLCGVLSWLCYLAIAFSARSLHESHSHDHGLLLLLALFGIAFGLYVTSLQIAVNLSSNRSVLAILWIGAVTFRITLLLSNPIEEIDLYRYLWDGAVSNVGISPFRYAPHQVLLSSSTEALPEDLARLVHLRDSSPELAAILRRVHFGELPTIYPPVGQVVFAVCSWLTPRDSSVLVRMTLMKAAFVGFDLITLALVIWLLRLTNRKLGWAFAYGWCPLVIKEIANSGHLDSLVIALTTLAIAWTVLALNSTNNFQRSRLVIGVALALGLGVGAKLYPVVLAPLLLWTIAKRIGWSSGVLWCLVFGAVSLLVLSPMRPIGRSQEPRSFDEPIVAIPSEDLPPLPPSEMPTTTRDPSESLQAFLSRWEMNDFLFLLVVENLRPTDELSPDQVAWFTVTPASWRTSLASAVQSYSGLPADRVPFILTRALLSLVFLILACRFAWRAGMGPIGITHQDSTDPLLESAFLTLVWFWLLLPTQNPWYLVWCMPFVAFACSRVWLALSGLAFMYYLRFWMTTQFPSPLLGTSYPGPQFFDFIVTWLEYAPWFLWLTFDWLAYQQIWSGLKVSRNHRANIGNEL